MLTIVAPSISTNAGDVVSVNDSITVKIEAKHIKEGKPGSCEECAIALAANEVFPGTYIRVGEFVRVWQTIRDYKQYLNLLPGSDQNYAEFKIDNIGKNFQTRFDELANDLKPRDILLTRTK